MGHFQSSSLISSWAETIGGILAAADIEGSPGMTSHIRIERHDAVGVLTIARREPFNSLDVETAQDFCKAGLALARDREVRAVVLRADGGVFCSGAARAGAGILRGRWVERYGDSAAGGLIAATGVVVALVGW
jgi:1,4-dihydroxy-2-naphthoyl-CoA synthase